MPTFWCTSHKRVAEGKRNQEPCCIPELGDSMVPCVIKTFNHSISVVNVRTAGLLKPHTTRFYCGRGSPLGNHHVMKDRSESERNRVCDAFAEDFLSPTTEQWKMLIDIKKQFNSTDVELACYCYPSRCHCDTILSSILSL